MRDVFALRCRHPIELRFNPLHRRLQLRDFNDAFVVHDDTRQTSCLEWGAHDQPAHHADAAVPALNASAKPFSATMTASPAETRAGNAGNAVRNQR
jgi:hypothetical protein